MRDKELYQVWLEKAVEDPELTAELKRIEGDEAEIEDRFYRELAFGTGGLRGVIGAGTNRLNLYTVRKATQGLCDYLNNTYETPSVAIAYDSRKNSDVFARTAAEVFAGNGVKAFLYSELMPTPMLSFAVRELGCNAGIVLTASHNPAKYNGYKVYGEDGCQITLEAANQITGYIGKIDAFDEVKKEPFDTALQTGQISYIGDSVVERYFEEVRKCSVYEKTGEADLKVVYSPLNGTGNQPVRRILSEIGLKDIKVVPEQEKPDPAFTTCPYPNPEIKEALALGLALAKKENADLLLATDPDCDRVGTAVRHEGQYVLINGNQMGVLLLDFVCRMRKASGTLPERPFAVKTIVTSEMAQAVADRYGVEMANVLTGFKFIGEQIGLLEKKGEADRYVFGFEESYGYLSGAYVRDKDAVNASMLICEMASYYKTQGKTLVDVLDALYEDCGYFYDRLESLEYEGISGMEKMAGIMQGLRENTPRQVAGYKVSATNDYLKGIRYQDGVQQKLTLPPSDVIGLQLEGGSMITVRPSGTEPKLKIYYSLRLQNRGNAEKEFAAVSEAMNSFMK